MTWAQKLRQTCLQRQFHPLSDLTAQQLEQYQQLLSKWNTRINLTAHRDPLESLHKNFLDCLSLGSFFLGNETVLDLGSGAGFPGLVLRIIHPDLSITLVEADQRKAAFLASIQRELSLQNVQIVNQHLSAAHFEQEKFSGRFDAVVSRATFPIEKLALFASASLKRKKEEHRGGILIWMAQETQTIPTLPSFEQKRVFEYQIPGLKRTRKIVAWEKL